MLVKSKVKYIQSLSHKKHRNEERLFIAEGPKIINELLQGGALEPVEIFALPAWLRNQQATSAAPVFEIDEETLSRISTLSTPNEVLGIFRMPTHAPFTPEKKLSILLSGIQDPGNLGTIIRCADWFGVEQVVCSPDCVDVFNPKTIQSTMGSIARVKVYYEDLNVVLTKFPEITLYAAVLGGEDIAEIGKISEGMLLIGNESKGIDETLLAHAHQKVTIPKKGHAESLNAAMAAAICLHALVK